MSTPHIEAAAGAFADTVLLPGDPTRARHIAETYLEQPRLVTQVRNMLGYSGSYRGRAISVMGSGMGIPSCSIYATELVRHYGVKRLIRVGSCGTTSPQLQLGDIVLAMGACTDSRVNRMRFGGYDFAAIASYPLLRLVADTAAARALPVAIGNIFSSDLFYHPDADLSDRLDQLGILGIEMEAAGLYGLAAQLGVEALAVLTVSDHLRTEAAMSPEQRATGLDTMIRLVLDSLV